MKYYKLHLIRHGLTQGNLDGRYIGSGTDLPLCAEGRAQLEELKKRKQSLRPVKKLHAFYRRGLLRGNPTAVSSRFAAALKELKEQNK